MHASLAYPSPRHLLGFLLAVPVLLVCEFAYLCFRGLRWCFAGRKGWG